MDNELIKLITNEEGKQLVSARELHEFLEINTRFDKWFIRMCEYGFSESNDFTRVAQKCPTPGGMQTIIDYAITIDNNISSNVVCINNEYIWPVIGYNRISSYFGKRNAPTKGASIYHSGIDIAAPTGSNLVSIFDGKIIYVGFNGASGYTIIIQNGN